MQLNYNNGRQPAKKGNHDVHDDHDDHDDDKEGPALDPFPSVIGTEEPSDLLSAFRTPVNAILGPLMILAERQVGQSA